MPLVIAILLVPLVFVISRKANAISTPKTTRIILNGLLVLISIVFIVLCWVVRAAPFDFEDHYSTIYMLCCGEYISMSGVIFMFSPFLWMVVLHFLRMILRSVRVRKNARIGKSEDFIYYRGDLDRVSPGIIMFLFGFEIDVRKCISATILKLKLTGFLKERSGALVCTEKEQDDLPESEKAILRIASQHSFSESEYRKLIEEEALSSKYVVKNRGGRKGRIAKIILAVCVPFLILGFSVWFDHFVFDNYNVYPDPDGSTYIILERQKDIEKLYEEVNDINDYRHSEIADSGNISYTYSWILADKLKYGVVRKAVFLNIACSLMIGWVGAGFLIALYIVIEQIVYMNKNYRRTIKGKTLLNKAYALKNYLKDYSLIDERSEEELILWEYYLVYAVALGVNEKIEDDLIEKYVSNNVL